MKPKMSAVQLEACRKAGLSTADPTYACSDAIRVDLAPRLVTTTSPCPPVVEYSRTEQSRIAEETRALLEGAKIIGWLADYAVMREQARACAIERP